MYNIMVTLRAGEDDFIDLPYDGKNYFIKENAEKELKIAKAVHGNDPEIADIYIQEIGEE